MSFYENATNVKEEDLTPTSQYLSAGKHHVTIMFVENKKTSTGGEQLVIQFQDIQEKIGFLRLNTINKSTTAVEISLQHFKSILTMVPKNYRDNFNKSKNPIDLIGADFYIIGKDTIYFKDGVEKNSVNFTPDSKKSLEMFYNPKKEESNFNDEPLDKYDPFDSESPF